eukprot:TRINITY_DN11318_c0_g1_i1.p1 TRINITY_DN11318_c0_g1~~TRINITY_DN11318_c0_g1_i1.p1  ORF type:complete len:740 (+),score=218.90 TRINITY_DN11318_c0_g1_i1:97-2316(+)
MAGLSEEDAALEAQAQAMAEKALAALPPEVRSLKIAAVKEGILKRLKAQQGAPPAAVAAAKTGAKAAKGPPPPTTMPGAPPPPATSSSGQKLQRVGSAEACGDELWFADGALCHRFQKATAKARSEQKIMVGAADVEIRRICPKGDHVLGAGAVLRLGSAHIGGYGEADITHAYRQLSRRLHPDKNPNVPEAPDAFKRLTEAADELKKALEDTRKTAKKLAAAVGSPEPTEEMLERPQAPLLAEATKLLMAVLALSGEGKTIPTLLDRAIIALPSMCAYRGCSPLQLLSRWHDSEKLLQAFAEAPTRSAYDCMPKRFRAQFLCALHRVATVEATRNSGCVRAVLTRALAQFPEVMLLRDFLERLRQRAFAQQKKPAALAEDRMEVESASESAEKAALTPSTWGARWRRLMADVLLDGESGVVTPADRELRKLGAALWSDVVAWAKDKETGDAERHLQLFAADDRKASLAAEGEGDTVDWSYIPLSDLLLAVGDDLVGMTVAGVFAVGTKATGPSAPRRSFAAALRRERCGTEKRGLALPSPEGPVVKKTKLNRGPTRVVLLTNMVGPGEVDDELAEETAEEAGKFGKLKQCIVREVKGAPEAEAVRIFLHFESIDAATKAYADMNGRYFDGRTVKARFFDEERFVAGDFEKKAPSAVLLLTNLVGLEDVDEELETDTASEARRYGEVKCAVVHTTAKRSSSPRTSRRAWTAKPVKKGQGSARPRRTQPGKRPQRAREMP